MPWRFPLPARHNSRDHSRKECSSSCLRYISSRSRSSALFHRSSPMHRCDSTLWVCFWRAEAGVRQSRRSSHLKAVDLRVCSSPGGRFFGRHVAPSVPCWSWLRLVVLVCVLAPLLPFPIYVYQEEFGGLTCQLVKPAFMSVSSFPVRSLRGACAWRSNICDRLQYDLLRYITVIRYKLIW